MKLSLFKSDFPYDALAAKSNMFNRLLINILSICHWLCYIQCIRFIPRPAVLIASAASE